MDKKQEECIKECIREIDTIKRRLTGLLNGQKIDTFEKPSLEEVVVLMGDLLEARRFYDYYESNGWKVGRNKMKNYKSAISQWKRRNEKNNRVSRSDRHDEATKRFLRSV